MYLRRIVSATVVIYLVILTIEQTFANPGVLWRSLSISRNKLLTGSRSIGSRDLPTTLRKRRYSHTCSLYCHQEGWCNLWCADPSSATPTCLFFNMYVVPQYQETDLIDALDCYTRNPKDYAVEADIEGAVPHNNSPERKVTNLVDGIYLYGDMSQCYYSSDFYNPWIKIDLQTVKPIRRIMIVFQFDPAATNFIDFELRIGVDNLPEEHFAKYKLFGYIPGPTLPGQEIVFSHDVPMMGRYISIQRWSNPLCNPNGSNDNTICHLQLCHIEIN